MRGRDSGIQPRASLMLDKHLALEGLFFLSLLLGSLAGLTMETCSNPSASVSSVPGLQVHATMLGEKGVVVARYDGTRL